MHQCHRCGSPCNQGQKFCSICGARLDRGQSVSKLVLWTVGSLFLVLVLIGFSVTALDSARSSPTGKPQVPPTTKGATGFDPIGRVVVTTVDFFCASTEEAEALAIVSMAKGDTETVRGLYDRGQLFRVTKGTAAGFLATGLSGELGAVLLHSGYHSGTKCWIPKHVLKLSRK